MDNNKYVNSIHQNDYSTIKDVYGETVAVIDSDELLQFIGNPSHTVQQEIKEYLDFNDIPYHI